MISHVRLSFRINDLFVIIVGESIQQVNDFWVQTEEEKITDNRHCPICDEALEHLQTHRGLIDFAEQYSCPSCKAGIRYVYSKQQQPNENYIGHKPIEIKIDLEGWKTE